MLWGSLKRSEEVRELVRTTGSIEIDGVRFPLVGCVEDLVTCFRTKTKTISSNVARYGKTCALLMDSRDVSREMSATAAELGRQDGGILFKFSQLLCFQCRAEYSDLALGGWGDEGNRCSQCDSGYVILAFDVPDDPTETDIPAVRKLLLIGTCSWWRTQSHAEERCCRCEASVPRDQGCMYGQRFHCEACMDRYVLSDALYHLKHTSLSYLGKGFLRRARHLAVQRHH
jgi:hypothetical protein